MSDNTTKRTCNTCHTEKPLTDFYAHEDSKGGHLLICKECFKAKRKARQKQGVGIDYQKQIVPVKSEFEAISLLRSRGIYATNGKSSEFKYVDAVCWGCVRVEVKQSGQDEDGTFLFKFSPQQVKRGVLADLILLICKWKNETTYHLLPANHPVFFWNGKRKKGVEFDPYQTRRKSGHGTRLTAAIMNQYKDSWELIEEQRLQIQKRLMGETTIKTTLEQPKQLDLTA